MKLLSVTLTLLLFVPGAFGDTYTFPDGSVYEGQLRDGVPHGLGKQVYTKGETYEGEWKDNKMDGFGKFVARDGKVSKGKWLKGRFRRKSDENLQPLLDAWEMKKQRWEQQRAKLKVALERPKPSPEKQPEYSPRSNDSNELITAASGSGFFVSKEGHLVTNNHVINHCSEVKFKHAGEVMDATVVARDRVNDLALLKTSLNDPTTLPISNSNPALLQDIYAAGFPFGSSISASVKVTKGIVSSLSGVADNFSNVQIDASLQPGNSGGPIVDEYGNAVAVAVAKLDLEKFSQEAFGVVPENTNFGIKATVVRNLLEGSGIQLTRPNTTKLSGAQLGQRITESTVHLSCLMTMAQIEQVRDQKVLFTEFD